MSLPSLTVNLATGALSFRLAPETAQTLRLALDQMIDTLKQAVVAKSGTVAGRVTPQPPIEYRHAGEIFLEVFCNPNIWPSPFAAKVLLTVRDEHIRLSTETELTRLVEDVNQYLEQL